jgi:hypothetical protein
MGIKSKSGRFVQGTLLSFQDLQAQTMRIGDHWLIPLGVPSALGSITRRSPGQRSWRITARKVRGAEVYFPPTSRPTVRAVLFALMNLRPPGKLRPRCGEKNCINPFHMEELMSLSNDLCERYFQEALLRLTAGEPFELVLNSEGDAIRYRAALNRWRKTSRETNETLGVSYDGIILRLRPELEKTPHGAYVLSAETTTDSFEAALETAIAAKPSPKTLSAKDLVLSSIIGRDEEETE